MHDCYILGTWLEAFFSSIVDTWFMDDVAYLSWYIIRSTYWSWWWLWVVVLCLVDAHIGDIVHMVESCLGDWSWWVDLIWLIRLMRQVMVIGCLDRLFIQIWCMVDALVHGTSWGTGWCMVGAWLMQIFYGTCWLQVVWYKLVHGWCTCLWYRLIGTCCYSGISHRYSVIVVPSF